MQYCFTCILVLDRAFSLSVLIALGGQMKDLENKDIQDTSGFISGFHSRGGKCIVANSKGGVGKSKSKGATTY